MQPGPDVYRLTDRWSSVTGPWPQQQTLGRPQLVEGRVLLSGTEPWCGFCPGPYTPRGPSQLVDPVTLSVEALPAGPYDSARPSLTWTGASLLALNPDQSVSARDGLTIVAGDLAVLDLTAGAWSYLPAAPVSQLVRSAPVWTGTRLVTLAADGRALTFRAEP